MFCDSYLGSLDDLSPILFLIFHKQCSGVIEKVIYAFP